MTKDYDLVILGHGSAAFAAAIKANDLGIRTAMIGYNITKGTLLGGTCVNVGCVPSKYLINISRFYRLTRMNSIEGIKIGDVSIDFRYVIESKEKIVQELRKEKYEDVLSELENVTYYNGFAKFASNKEVKIGKDTIYGKKFIIATGTRPNIPVIKGINNIDYLTNEEALSLKEIPRSLCVVGGRALGLEFAQMFSNFGSKVVVIQRSNRIPPTYEPEISDELRRILEEDGIEIFSGVQINEITKKGELKVINASTNGKKISVECEKVLFATGRKPNTENLNLDKVGVATDKDGFIIVNEEMQTSATNVWAAGDVVGYPMHEPLAAKQGAVAVENIFLSSRKKVNLNEVPEVVFTYPEVAKVGLTEAEAVRRGARCSCKVLPLYYLPKARIIGEHRGLMKLVIDAENKKVIGANILAPNASEIIHECTLAVKLGLTIDDLIDTVHVFPTFSELVKLTAQSFYKDVSKLSCCFD
ncbi:MAG: mercury(II) reductase [Thermoproteota archaeon]